MREELAEAVFPVLTYALKLRDRLRAGESPALEVEQATFTEMLDKVEEAPGAEAVAGDPLAGLDQPDARLDYLGAAYPLTCWLDELFILDSPWRERWNENKLEVARYGSNDRAWLYWQQARLAEPRAVPDALEVFYLGAVLGFRGEWADDPARLQAWVAATRQKVSRGLGMEWVTPPELELPTDVPPRRGRQALRRLAVVAGAAVLFAVPVVVVYVSRHLAQ